jgi:hypothetical protein
VVRHKKESPVRLSSAILGAAALAACGASVASAAPTVEKQFEPEPCIATLAPQYTVNPFGPFSVVLPDSIIACPTGVTWSPRLYFGATLSNEAGSLGPGISYRPRSYYDPVQNAIVADNAWTLSVYAPRDTGTFDRFEQQGPWDGAGPFITSDEDKYYRLVLGGPVSVVRTTANSPSCTIALGPTLGWRWNQAAYWVIPDSAIQCQGRTFRSAEMDVYVTFNSRQENQALLRTEVRPTYDPVSRRYTDTYELRLYNRSPSAPLAPRTGEKTEDQTSGGSAGALPGQPVWGAFTLGTTQPLVDERDPTVPRIAVRGFSEKGRDYFHVNLAAPFTLKRETDVSLKARRVARGTLRLSIKADRNTAFQNTIAPTYRRQTVLPGTRADHAVLRRGNTVLKRIKLSPYGTATVTVKDPPGRNRYSVTMVATDDNFQGVARVAS